MRASLYFQELPPWISTVQQGSVPSGRALQKHEHTSPRNHYKNNSLRFRSCIGPGPISWVLCNETENNFPRVFQCNGQPHPIHRRAKLSKLNFLTRIMDYMRIIKLHWNFLPMRCFWWGWVHGLRTKSFGLPPEYWGKKAPRAMRAMRGSTLETIRIQPFVTVPLISRWSLKGFLARGRKMSTNFLCTNFSNIPRGPGHPGKNPGTSQVPPFETEGRQTFEGGHELFGHHPFAWKTPTPANGLRTQKVNLCALFLLHDSRKVIFWCKVSRSDNLSTTVPCTVDILWQFMTLHDGFMTLRTQARTCCKAP